MIPFIKYTKVWLGFSAVQVLLAVLAIIFLGFNWGIDFKGGSLLEVKFNAPVEISKIEEVFTQSPLSSKLGAPVITPTNNGTHILHFRYLEENELKDFEGELSKKIGSFTNVQFNTTGPTLGSDLRVRALRAIVYATIAIIMYLAATFRNTKRDSLAKYVTMGSLLGLATVVGENMVESQNTRWIVFIGIVIAFLMFLAYEVHRRTESLKYGVCAVVALAHDIIIILGCFAIFGYLLGVEFNALTVTALLTIMGFSVHDTIVVFDRVRENRKFQKIDESFGHVADHSLNQTLARSINTSLSTIIVLTVLFVLGPQSIHWFVGALWIGITVGTYSSIFVATPLVVIWEKAVRG
jgi:preprotein translocase subunit SecF